MPVYKRKNTSGKINWFFKFQRAGARRGVLPIRGFGYLTKQAAMDAEVARRGEEQRKTEVRKRGAPRVAAALPTTLAMLLAEFMKQHAQEKLAPKTIERYFEMAEYIAPELAAMPLPEITPLHLNREWARLLACGGHTRKTKAPRAMKPKTVRNIACLVSSAFVRAIRWGLVTTNPVTNSEPPKVRKRIGMALVTDEQEQLVESAVGPWCLGAFLEVCRGSGARRGEVLALRWSDVRDGCAFIDRSLCQTRAGLVFKGTKTERPRKVDLPPSTIPILERHRERQNEFRAQFGPRYRADLDLIFANPDGTPLKPNSVSATVSRICKQAGLPKGASLHVLRHSHASQLLQEGLDPVTVSERLGHSSVRTTADIYAHAMRGKDAAAARLWDAIQERDRTEKSKGVN
jgi:integrase